MKTDMEKLERRLQLRVKTAEAKLKRLENEKSVTLMERYIETCVRLDVYLEVLILMKDINIKNTLGE